MKTKTLYWILGAWLTFLAISMLAGCKTKSVVEVMQTHDTLRIYHTDTLYKVRTDLRTDTLRIETERVLTLSDKGDTIRVAIYRDRWRDRIVHQTDTVREVKTDTAYRAVAASEDKEIVRQTAWWEKVGFLAIVTLLAAVAVIGMKK